MAHTEGSDTPEHPGNFVRRHVLPEGMSVTKAAALLGIGRPALSAFLNGKASLSKDMARKLERAFKADRDGLLDLQARYDRRDGATRTPVVAGRAVRPPGKYAPALKEIRAKDIIERWADGTSAREYLPALLRRLVHATGYGLTRVDFPAFENAQRPGPDGEVETASPTPWIPEGRSVWEFGCGKDPRKKAKNDYDRRVASLSPMERGDTTFVFVTPREWPKRKGWAAEKAASGDWKDVRAYDASDIEQWLEQSAETQIWLAERFGDPVSGYRSLDMCWSDWAEECEPALTPRLFSAPPGHIEDFRNWLAEEPDRPFIIASDSSDEALAFACHLVRERTSAADEPNAGALVFDKPEAIRRFRLSKTLPRIMIVHDEKTEREIRDAFRSCHCIIVRPGNDVGRCPDIRLGLHDYARFSDALETMGLPAEKIDRLVRESGRSPAILRRRLSKIPARHIPGRSECAKDTAGKLLPFALVGVWRNSARADSEAVRTLARANGDNDVEIDVTELLDLSEPPLWATKEYRGVASRIEALFEVAKFVTAPDLENFFSVAERILSERDPALDLPEGERWIAGLRGKVRDHSSELRKGIAETLALLAVYGDNLFGDRLPVDIRTEIATLVRKLLTPLTMDRLLSQLGDLPAYAEAAPDAFLKIIEDDLRKDDPEILGLLKPVEGDPFGPGEQRSGLLRALEMLGWECQHLDRVSRILARLASFPIYDNWANRPINSLEALYRAWLPQTSATLEERIRSLQSLTERYPDAVWQICIAQLKTGPRVALRSYRPRWRGDVSGADRDMTDMESGQFRRRALDLVLAWPDHDHETLGELVDILHHLSAGDRNAVWDLIDAWAESHTDSRARAILRERVRKYALNPKKATDAADRARDACERLEPGDTVMRHLWLFSGSWMETSFDWGDGKPDHQARRERIDRLRIDAMDEIWRDRGFEGVMALLADGICRVPDAVGECLAVRIVEDGSRADFLNLCLSVTGPSRKMMMDLCVQGFLRVIEDDTRGGILAHIAENSDEDGISRLYSLAPFRRHTWRLLDRYPDGVRDRYWKRVRPEWKSTGSELAEVIDRLLDAERPLAVFSAMSSDPMNWPGVETSQLKRLLEKIPTSDADSPDHGLPEAYDLDRRISDVFDELDRRGEVGRDDMVRLEFSFLAALDHSRHGIPNLERRIAESPVDFVRFLALLYDRDDGGEDPVEWRIGSGKQREFADNSYRLLQRISLVPGMKKDGAVDVEALRRWVSEARRLCGKYGRARVGDTKIGKLLSRAPKDGDGIQPSLAVSEVLESVGSPDILDGFVSGIYYGQGVMVGEGGFQEREIAAKYRNWAGQRFRRFPFVASALEKIATSFERLAERQDEKARTERRLY